MSKPAIKLIINADDYGYFPCISQGILSLAKAGKLTATGVLANSAALHEQLQWLEQVPKLDVGVHLNLSFQQPLTPLMTDKLAAWNGKFPGIGQMLQLILKRQISLQDIRQEWRAQISACHGLELTFLNSHEHIHMLPLLFPLTLQLAKEFSIPHVRLTRADWQLPASVPSMLRNSLIQSMQLINQFSNQKPSPIMLGLSHSGRLNFDYLNKLFPQLVPGKTYELMCHPGFFNGEQISEPKLIAYHDWEGELALLQSPAVADLYDRYNICLAHFPKQTVNL
jgi:hypothetical protein